MQEREGLAFLNRSPSGMKGISGARRPSGDVTPHPLKLSVVGDCAGSADHASNLHRDGIDQYGAAGAVSEIAAGVPCERSHCVHCDLLLWIEVPASTLRDLNDQIGDGFASRTSSQCASDGM